MIFANHAHIYPKQVREKGTVDALKRYLDECGIDKCVAFSTFPDILRSNGIELDQNKSLYDEIKGNHDIVGFGTVDPSGDTDAQLEQIAGYGFKGIKIHPQVQDLPLAGEKAFKIYKKCEELGLFISFHSGIHWNRMRDTAVVLFDEVAYNFQNLRFSMEHIGGYSFFNEALAVMVNNKRDGIQPRVYAGWTSIAGEDDSWSISDKRLYTLLKQTTDNNSIFGLDFPFKSVEYNKDAIKRIKELNIPEESKDKILGGNLANALGVRLF